MPGTCSSPSENIICYFCVVTAIARITNMPDDQDKFFIYKYGIKNSYLYNLAMWNKFSDAYENDLQFTNHHEC